MLRDTVGGDGGIDSGRIFTLEVAGEMLILGDSGGTVTLRDAGGIGTRGDGDVTVRAASCGGTMLGSAGFAMAISNISARSTMAC